MDSAVFSLILITAAVGMIPMVLFGYHSGHDLSIHLSSWIEAEQQFRHGNWFPRWAAGANYGFGEPRFIFYPPISWMIGGMLGLILPWKLVPGTYVFLVLVLAGTTMWKLAIDWLTPADALLASVIYAVNPYAMTTAYTRYAFGELLAGALFPLLVWAALRLARERARAVVPLAFVFAAIWLANLPAGVIATYAFCCLLLISCRVNRSLRLLWYGAAAIVAGFGVSAFALFPAAYERKWVNISAVVSPMYLPWNNFLFTRKNIPLMLGFNRKLSFLAVGLIAATLVAAFLAKALRRNSPEIWWPLAILGVVAASLMFPFSQLLWQRLPELRFVQFPWRWLFPLCMASALLIASAISGFDRKRIWSLAVILILIATDGIIGHTSEPDSHTVRDTVVSTRSGAGYRGLLEYAPIGAEVDRLPTEAPLIALVNPPGRNDDPALQRAIIDVGLWAPDRRVILSNLPEPFSIDLKLLAYPSWRVKINGVAADPEVNKETGQIRLHLPAGASRCEVVFAYTWDRIAGIAISFISVIGLFICGMFIRNQEVLGNGRSRQWYPA